MLKTKTDYSNFKPDTVFYHGKCFDGLGAAYVFWKKYGDEKVSNYIFLHTDLEDFMVFKSFTRYEKDLTNYIKEGETMELLVQKQISNAVKASRVVNFMGYKVALSQTSVHVSEVGNTLVKNYEVDFAII